MIRSSFRVVACVALVGVAVLSGAASCQAGVMRATTEVRVSAYVAGGCGAVRCLGAEASHDATTAVSSELARSITAGANWVTIAY